MVIVTTAFVVAEVRGLPSPDELRGRVEDAGISGVLLFLGGYVLLTLVPAPKGLFTAVAGALYGLWAGAALAWLAAMLGAGIAFGVGRLLGRDAIDRLLRGRVARLDDLLTDHGLTAVVAVRLVPVLPFTAINYAAGLTGVRRRDYAAGSALGMIPGSLAYAAFGAWGASPWGIFAALAALVLLVLVGGLVGRRVLGRSVGGPEGDPVGPAGASGERNERVGDMDETTTPAVARRGRR